MGKIKQSNLKKMYFCLVKHNNLLIFDFFGEFWPTAVQCTTKHQQPMVITVRVNDISAAGQFCD